MPFCPTLEARLQRWTERKAATDGFYLATYPVIRRFFDERICVPKPTESDIQAGVVLVYSWMGRGQQKLSQQHLDKARETELLNVVVRAQASDDLIEADIGLLMGLVGGSLIGTSKFLHMVNPSRYAMWDSNVALAAYCMSAPSNVAATYSLYLDDLRRLNLPVEVRRKILESLPDAPELRIKEFALFHLGIAEKADLEAKKAKSPAASSEPSGR